MTKSYQIAKQSVCKAWESVRKNKGAAGSDGVSLTDYEEGLKQNLYKLWNRLSSGSYFPAPVKAVDIPKHGGGTRTLSIPTIEDRIAQTVVKQEIEVILEPLFLDESYGYRPGRSALDAIASAKE